MRKIVSLLFAGTLLFGSANAQILSEQNVTINMDLQPVLQLSIEGPEQIDFNFTEIDQYYAGIVKNGANVLKVSSSVSFDLWAVGLSQGNVAALCMDQLIDYQGGGASGLNAIPVTALELHQFPPNPLVTAATATCDAGVAMNLNSDYSANFVAMDNATNLPLTNTGNNCIYAPVPTTPYIAPQMTGVATAEEKYIAGGDGVLAGCSVVGGSYLTNAMNFNDGAGPPSLAGTGLPVSPGYYFVMDYRIVPGLPSSFPMHIPASNANSTAATLVAAAAATNLATPNNYAAPGVYSMYVKYILAEDQ
tara:strand:- start:22 stop:936 length:915 start_codon:yes stop_codon:yes gene_type:complete